MSSKTKTTATKEEATATLVPNLRFPEFRGAEGWHIKLFEQLFTIGNGRDHKHLLPGDVPVYGSGGYMRSVDEYLYDGESVCIGRKGTINNPMFLTGRFWTVDTLFYTHSFNQCLPKFIWAIFQQIDWLKHNEAGGIPSLSKTNIEKIKTAIPKPAEQQKIAECLSSVDELMAAQARKVDALKTHKKGLMQQLFPREGETQPRLRFPEFQNAGEWEENSFGRVVKIGSGKGFKASEYSKTGIRLLQIENVGYGVTKWSENTIYLPESYATEYPELVLRGGDIVLALNRPVTNDELKIAKIQKHEPIAILYQRVGRLEILDDSLLVDFVFHFCRQFIKDFVVNKSIGSDQPFISLKDLYSQNLRLPAPPEQQRIADCLTSLDALIAAQTQKLEALKTHKNGLMQQLFPSPKEVEV